VCLLVCACISVCMCLVHARNYDACVCTCVYMGPCVCVSMCVCVCVCAYDCIGRAPRSVQELAFFDKSRTGELINRLSTDTTLIAKYGFFLVFFLCIWGFFVCLFAAALPPHPIFRLCLSHIYYHTPLSLSFSLSLSLSLSLSFSQ